MDYEILVETWLKLYGIASRQDGITRIVVRRGTVRFLVWWGTTWLSRYPFSNRIVRKLPRKSTGHYTVRGFYASSIARQSRISTYHRWQMKVEDRIWSKLRYRNAQKWKHERHQSSTRIQHESPVNSWYVWNGNECIRRDRVLRHLCPDARLHTQRGQSPARKHIRLKTNIGMRQCLTLQIGSDKSRHYVKTWCTTSCCLMQQKFQEDVSRLGHP